MSAYDAQKDIRAVVLKLDRREICADTAAAALEAVVLLAERHARADGRDLGVHEAADAVQSFAQRFDDGAQTRALVAAARKVRALAGRSADGTYRAPAPDALTGAHPADDRP